MHWKGRFTGDSALQELVNSGRSSVVLVSRDPEMKTSDIENMFNITKLNIGPGI